MNTKPLVGFLTSMPSQLLVLVIRVYQLFVSPALHLTCGPGLGCRFTPTCSEYAKEAVEVHGLLHGAIVGAYRLLRCNPWSKEGYDPLKPPFAGFREIPLKR